MINELLVNLVNSVLGESKRTARGNQAYHCPFCNHHKPKLEVNFTENKKGFNPWHCWVCGKKVRPNPTHTALCGGVPNLASWEQVLEKIKGTL